MPILRGNIASAHQQQNVPVHQTSYANNNHPHHHHRHSAVMGPNPDTIIRMSNPCKNSAPPPTSEYKRRDAFQDLPLLFYEPPSQRLGRYYNPNYPDFPWQILTLIRFIQLVETNISMYMLTKNEELLTYLHLTKSGYALLVLALTVHFVAWLFEENVVRRINRGKSAGVLCGLITISFLYTISCSFMAVCLYVCFNNKDFVTFGVTLGSVLYFGYHLHWISKSVRVTLAIERHNGANNAIYFNNTTRPETDDMRLNIGPHLVFPKLEDYSVPE